MISFLTSFFKDFFRLTIINRLHPLLISFLIKFPSLLIFPKSYYQILSKYAQIF